MRAAIGPPNWSSIGEGVSNALRDWLWWGRGEIWGLGRALLGAANWFLWKQLPSCDDSQNSHWTVQCCIKI